MLNNVLFCNIPTLVHAINKQMKLTNVIKYNIFNYI